MYVVDAIEAYERQRASTGLAPRTLSNTHTQLGKLAKAAGQWQREHGKRSPMKCSEMDPRLITLFFERCKGDTGNRNNMTVCLRGFLNFTEAMQFVKPGTVDRLMTGRKLGHYQRRPKYYIAPQDFGTMLSAAQDRHPADRATMALLLYTLARRGELAGLQVKHIDMEALTIKVYREKTRRWTDVGICPELYQELSNWMAFYQAEMGQPLDPEWYLLPRLNALRWRGQFGTWENKTSYALSPTEQPAHMEKIVKRGLDAVGVKTTVPGNKVSHYGEGAHTIRRSGARAMLKHLSAQVGYADALVTVAAMLDHSDVKMTLRYIGMDKQKEELNDWLRGNSMYGTSPSRAKLSVVA